jgi:hypothetical protein
VSRSALSISQTTPSLLSEIDSVISFILLFLLAGVIKEVVEFEAGKEDKINCEDEGKDETQNCCSRLAFANLDSEKEVFFPN